MVIITSKTTCFWSSNSSHSSNWPWCPSGRHHSFCRDCPSPWATNRTKTFSSSSNNGIIISSIIVGIKKLFKPLDKFKIILESPFNQFFDWNDLRQTQVTRAKTFMKEDENHYSWLQKNAYAHQNTIFDTSQSTKRQP